MKTVIEMARHSGYGDHMSVLHAPALERFAELVRADERAILAEQPVPVQQEPVARYIGEGSEGSLVQLYDDVKKGTDFYTSPQPAQPIKPCEWQREDDIHMPDTWRSDCGVMWTFTDGGPVENDMKYCCGCGAKLREKNT
jgi:hypothetical protein